MVNVMRRNDEETSVTHSVQDIDSTAEQNSSEGNVVRNRLDNRDENLHEFRETLTKMEEKLDALTNRIDLLDK